MEEISVILDKLKKIEIFSDFNENTEENEKILKLIYSKLGKKDFKKDEVIISEGEEGSTLYLLYEGTVQVRRKTPSNEEFAVVNLSSKQNVFFGELALIDQDKRSASVKALTDCKTLTLEGKDFIEICESNPLVGYKVIYKIAKRISSSLRKSNSDLLALYQALLDEVENRI